MSAGIPIGYSPDGRHAISYRGSGHLLTVAAARTGKGATLLIDALLSWRGSCICCDPKGRTLRSHQTGARGSEKCSS